LTGEWHGMSRARIAGASHEIRAERELNFCQKFDVIQHNFGWIMMIQSNMKAR
jgi:hypothetical protein